MVEWAQQAGKLAFQEIHEFTEDCLVTMSSLSLFWHSQGSWRMAMLHKGQNNSLVS